MALGLWQALRPARASLKWQVFSGALRSALRPTTVILLLIALAWVMVTAAGGIFDVHNLDWYTHRSIFLDLSRGDWPTEPSPNLRAYLGAPLLLRHYLGYFLVPGLIGNWIEPAALNWAVPLWTWCGVALAMFMFTRGHRGWMAFAAAAILIFFGGMDIVRILLFDGWGWINLNIDIQGWPLIELGRHHIEWAGGRWGIPIQYSSHTIGLLWTPKHFLPGALFTLLLFQLRRQPRFLAVSGVVWAASLFWSVFVAIGLLPFVAVILLQKRYSPLLALAKPGPGSAASRAVDSLPIQRHWRYRRELDMGHRQERMASGGESVADGVCVRIPTLGGPSASAATNVALGSVLCCLPGDFTVHASLFVWGQQ